MTTSRRTQMVPIQDGRLCVETFGDAADPSLLLIQGMTASMLWWPASVCDGLAGRGLHVVRYDQRDTGLASGYPRGGSTYSTTDLTEDACAIGDVLGLDRLHVVAVSLGCHVALTLAVDHPARVASLTMMSSSTMDDDLPPPRGDFPSPPDDLDSRAALMDYLVADAFACDGLSPHFDAARVRRLIEADLDRSHDPGTAVANHAQLRFDEPRGGSLEAIGVPTLVIQGEHDGLFSPPHGEAVRRAVPGARLVVLPGGGHTLQAPNEAQFVEVVAAHVLGAGR